MLIVAGVSLRNLEPRVWDPGSDYHLPDLKAVMISYADFHLLRARREAAMKQGLRAYLKVPRTVKVYLDNGSFFFGKRGDILHDEYNEFIEAAKPDWWPIPQDFIPKPRMQLRTQERCLKRTMEVNVRYEHDGYVPVMHVSRVLKDYVRRFKRHPKLAAKTQLALGGIVPNLLRANKAIPYQDVLRALSNVRRRFQDKKLHVFGIGGTATLHIAGLLGIDSVDSSGWRNRAARGLVQLSGTGDRMVAELGNWRGRAPSRAEWNALRRCRCPACRQLGVVGLKSAGIEGFKCRATHNLWVLLKEADWVAKRLKAGNYERYYTRRLDNTIYLPLIRELIESRKAGPRTTPVR